MFSVVFFIKLLLFSLFQFQTFIKVRRNKNSFPLMTKWTIFIFFLHLTWSLLMKKLYFLLQPSKKSDFLTNFAFTWDFTAQNAKKQVVSKQKLALKLIFLLNKEKNVAMLATSSWQFNQKKKRRKLKFWIKWDEFKRQDIRVANMTPK